MTVKVGFVSLGCSKNLVDTEVMLKKIEDEGFLLVPNPEDADVIAVNTCAFIDSAKEESINTILEMAEYKKNGKCKALIVCGCLAQRYYKEFKTLLPEVDGVVGASGIDKICDAVKNVLDKKHYEAIFDINRDIEYPAKRIITTNKHVAYLKISEGCDNYCTYCAIPYIRGKQRSRSIESLFDEAKELVLGGVKEIILVAQDSANYGKDLYGKKMIVPLVKELAKIEGLKWIRLHYCYPENIDDDLIDLYKNEDKLVKYLDIPLQHINDRILKLMGRRTNRKNIENILNKIKNEVTDITIRTSLIVGFPTETKEEFKELCEFLKKGYLDRIGAFGYSPEENTPAYRLKGQIEDKVKEIRLEKLMLTAKETTKKRNEKMIGKVVPVITDGFDENLYFGRSHGESLEVDPNIFFGSQKELNSGDIVNVRIKDFDEYDLYGEEEI